MTASVRAFLGVVALIFAAPAAAQTFSADASGVFGQINLQSGFTPDPHLTLPAGGAINARSIDPTCTGMIADRALYSLNYIAAAGNHAPLVISATSHSDTTLVIRAPDGTWHCDDDSGGDFNPSVRFETPHTGRYQIWVGVFSSESGTPDANLRISESDAGNTGSLEQLGH
jgi:hypothetical protein